MNEKIETRHPNSPTEAATMNTAQLRGNFLIEKVFEEDAIHLTLSFYDRYISGGAMPVNQDIELPNPENLKAKYFLERREMGIINIGGKGTVEADGEKYELDFKEALYISKETKKVNFHSADKSNPAKFYINSAPAHRRFSTKKITKKEAEIVTLGSLENSNHRTINKLIVNSVVETCQLQMGMTELKTGSVWNTMPAHTHDRR
ncbi:MAG TPA: 5-dehydro-4-deoxy-D-glucuronate isomerase, partial [Hanamia sp.]